MYDISEIKSKINCIEYAQQNGIPVTRPGDRAPSPFHSGKNPTSFVCYTDSWYSFSDELGGDVIDLCAHLKHNGNKGEAIRDLARLTNTKADYDSSQWFRYMQDLGNRVAYYHTQLTEDDREYIHSRGITDGTIDRLLLGRDENGRLVIPYWKNNQIVYYCTRALPGCKFPESKYRKLKTDNYNENCPWGLDTLNTDQTEYLIIAEGAFDAMSCIEQGYPLLSAITGHFPNRQIPEVINNCRRFKTTILTYDTDPVSHAGEKFTIKMAQTLFANGIDFMIAPMPAKIHDLSEYHQAGLLISDLIETAKPGMSYMCESFTEYKDLKKFVLSIARNTPVDELMLYLSHTQFDPSVIKELIKAAKNCPYETTIADEIMERHTLLYVLNDSFYEWNDRYWERIDDLTIMRYAEKQYGHQFATAQRILNVTKFLRSRVVNDIKFNKNPVISFKNGTLELDTGTFREHRPNDYVSILLNYDYDPTAQCPKWVKFINDITADEPHREELLQQIAGYVLFPDCRYQKIFVFVGAGANGKSVYLEMLEHVFDRKNCTYVDPANMDNEFWIVHFKDSLLNFATEIGNDFSKAENMLKMLSDGTTVQACYKGQNHITFEPRAKLVFACNDIPKTKTINGMERRLHFVRFPVSFREYPDPTDPYQKLRNVNILNELLTELPGIFNWCYAGYRSLLHYNELTETPEQAEIMKQFREQSNPIEMFVDDFRQNLTGRVSKSDTYNLYKQWCYENGHLPKNSRNFHEAFKDLAKKFILDIGDMRVIDPYTSKTIVKKCYDFAPEFDAE